MSQLGVTGSDVDLRARFKMETLIEIFAIIVFQALFVLITFSVFGPYLLGLS